MNGGHVGSIETGNAHVRGSKIVNGSNGTVTAALHTQSSSLHVDNCCADSHQDHNQNHTVVVDADHPETKYRRRRGRTTTGAGAAAASILRPSLQCSYVPCVILLVLMAVITTVYWGITMSLSSYTDNDNDGTGNNNVHKHKSRTGATGKLAGDMSSLSFVTKEKIDHSLESLPLYVLQQATDDDYGSSSSSTTSSSSTNGAAAAAAVSSEQHQQLPLPEVQGPAAAATDINIHTNIDTDSTDSSSLSSLPKLPISSRRRSTQLGQLFTASRRDDGLTGVTAREAVTAWNFELDWETRNNVHGGVRWLQPNLMPPLKFNAQRYAKESRKHDDPDADKDFFSVDRMDDPPMIWETEWKVLQQQQEQEQGGGVNGGGGPPVDYTVRDKYHYPDVLAAPPVAGGYPKLKSMKELMDIWPQDEDYTGTFTEELQHFDFTDPVQMKAARKFRDAELPFKVYNVPEVLAASEKWTDEYLHHNFKDKHAIKNLLEQFKPGMPKAQGYVQESANNFFAFFFKHRWDVEVFGLPPSRQNDWNFGTWARHARFADAAPLAADQPHFYFQSGVAPEERDKPYRDWCFISRDLPSFSSPTETFFVFHPDKQKGIQCRFGERGVTAATHYDTGRNMIAMINGAKRYILSPPKECGSLGLFTKKKTSPVYRHSMLNFGHVSRLDDPDPVMSAKERGWLERVAASQAIDTVLKKGEVMYVPSHWFHYIISVQMSAQCNVRSGVDEDGTPEFGNRTDVLQCKTPNEE